jgi:molybdate transport system permease protein
MLAFVRALGDFGASMMVAGDIPGLTQTASMAIFDAVNANETARAGRLTFWISAASIGALWLVQQTIAPRGPGR